jgi:glycosyltransferase involved in cell wall biosynthesis
VYSYLFSGDKFRIIVHNHEDQAFLCSKFAIPREWVRVTGGCGVDPSRFPFDTSRPSNDVPVVYVPVRLLAEKGVLEICEASRLLDGLGIRHVVWFTSNIDSSDPRCLSAGDLQRLSEIAPNVRFLGYQPTVDEVFRKSDIICVPTWYREGLPTAILEAAAIGRPIITTDNVGGREFVRDGIDGLLVPPRSPKALAQAIAYLVRHPQAGEAMRRSAYLRFRAAYTKHHMLKITLQACTELCPQLREPLCTDRISVRDVAGGVPHEFRQELG